MIRIYLNDTVTWGRQSSDILERKRSHAQMMLSRNVHGDARIFYTSTIHHQFGTLAFYHPKPSNKTIQNHPTPRISIVFPWFFPWFFHGFSWCSPWKQLDVENLTIFQTAFPTSQVKSVAQAKPGGTAPGGFQAWKKCMFASKKIILCNYSI